MSEHFGKIKRFLSRILIYQIVLLWPLMKLFNLEKNSVDFKEKLFRNFSFFGLENKTLYEYAEDPSLLLVLSSSELIVGILAIFGSFYGNLLSAILFLINCLIYFNPLFPENKISFYETRIEVLYNFGILLGILLCVFYPYDKENKKLREIIDADEEYAEEKVTFKPPQYQKKNVKKPKKK
jgi:hypothetical protein